MPASWAVFGLLGETVPTGLALRHERCVERGFFGHGSGTVRTSTPRYQQGHTQNDQKLFHSAEPKPVTALVKLSAP